jgi:hypothetical protein
VDVRAAGAEDGVSEASHDDVLEPKVRIGTAVGLLDFVTALVPVGRRGRLAHVSHNTLRCGEIVHVPSRGRIGVNSSHLVSYYNLIINMQLCQYGAGEETLTLDLFLGKEAL